MLEMDKSLLCISQQKIVFSKLTRHFATGMSAALWNCVYIWWSNNYRSVKFHCTGPQRRVSQSIWRHTISFFLLEKERYSWTMILSGSASFFPFNGSSMNGQFSWAIERKRLQLWHNEMTYLGSSAYNPLVMFHFTKYSALQSLGFILNNFSDPF